MTRERQQIAYGTLGCMLCEDAVALAAPEAARVGFVLRELDIADDPELFAAYAERIPVVRRSDRGVELGWPFDRHALRLLLQDDDQGVTLPAVDRTAGRHCGS